MTNKSLCLFPFLWKIVIGFKRIVPFTFCRRIETGPNLKERVAIQKAAREAAEASLAAGIAL